MIRHGIRTFLRPNRSARKPIKDELGYRRKLAARLDKTATLIQSVADSVKATPKKIVFAEGEQESVILSLIHI